MIAERRQRGSGNARPRSRGTLSFALCVFAATAAVAAGQFWPEPFRRAGSAVSNAASPAIGAASEVLRGVGGVWTGALDLVDLRRELERARRENERLREWRAEAQYLESENAVLRALFGVRPQPARQSLTAQVIGGASGPYQHSILANAGEVEGVRDGAPAVDGSGLVGRVVAVGRSSSRILLLTDVNSRVPVVLRESGARAILAGDGSNLPTLLLSSRSNPQTGELIVTSGDGGLYGPGLPVGRVEAITASTIRVAPFARFGALEFVRILERPRGQELAEPAAIVTPAPPCPCPSQPAASATGARLPADWEDRFLSRPPPRGPILGSPEPPDAAPAQPGR